MAAAPMVPNIIKIISILVANRNNPKNDTDWRGSYYDLEFESA